MLVLFVVSFTENVDLVICNQAALLYLIMTMLILYIGCFRTAQLEHVVTNQTLSAIIFMLSVLRPGYTDVRVAEATVQCTIHIFKSCFS